MDLIIIIIICKISIFEWEAEPQRGIPYVHTGFNRVWSRRVELRLPVMEIRETSFMRGLY